MAKTILSRYLDPEVLSRAAHRPFEPRNLVIGNLAGAHKSPMSGFAVEFAGHREYVPGDDPRHVDWRVYFTRDKYFVKQYEMETNFVCHLLLDISASMRYGEGTEQKLLYASQMAATLGYAVVRQSDKVSLTTFDQSVRDNIPPSNSMDQVLRMAQHLDQIEAIEKTDMAECLNEFATRIGRREIVIIFSDFLTNLDSLENAIGRLRYGDHEVVLFHVLHHNERTFNFDGMVNFIGLEQPDQMLVRSEDLREGYLRALANFSERLESMSQKNSCELIPVDTSQNMAEVFADYLNHRQQRRAWR